MKDNLSAYNSEDYDCRVGTVLPYYKEFHIQIIDLIKSIYTGVNSKCIKWLDTGCGTGSLAEKVLREFTNVKLTLCDPSEKMLNKAMKKLCRNDIQFINVPTQKMKLENEFDVVTAVQAHHYLDTNTRKEATFKCYNALKENGVYITFENIKLSSDLSDVIGQKRYENFLRSNGKTESEIKAHLARRGSEVLPITIENHINLLKNCGFKTADILWASYLQAGFWAVK